RLGPTRRGHEEHERPPRRRATPPRTNEGDRAPAAAAVRGRGRGQPPAAAARPPGGAAVGGGARDAAAGAPLREEQRHGRARPLLPQLGRHRQRAGSPRVALPRHVAAHRAGHRRRRGGALHHGGRHQGPRSPAREQELPLVRRARARAHLSGVRSPLREDAVRRDGPELARQGGPAEQRVRDRRQRQPGVPAQGRAGGLLPARQPRRRRPQPQLGRGVAAGRRAGRKGHEPWAQGLQRARDQGLQAAHAGVQADHIPDGPQRHQGDVHALGVRHGAPGQPQPAPDDADPEGPGQGPLRMPLRCRGQGGWVLLPWHLPRLGLRQAADGVRFRVRDLHGLRLHWHAPRALAGEDGRGGLVHPQHSHLAHEHFRDFFTTHPSNFVQVNRSHLHHDSEMHRAPTECFAQFNPSDEGEFKSVVDNWSGAYLDMADMVARQLRGGSISSRSSNKSTASLASLSAELSFAMGP
ncbi:unnamed protein product, partial [Prorocentrum cordatum]